MKRVLTVASLFVMSALLAPAQAKEYPLPTVTLDLSGKLHVYRTQ